MRSRLAGMAAVALTGVLLAAGCGGGGDKESEGARTACKANATTQATAFPPRSRSRPS